MVTALIEGSVGAGKTALAAKIALEANFPCVRLITPQALVHHGEGKWWRCCRMNHMSHIFDSILYKCTYRSLALLKRQYTGYK